MLEAVKQDRHEHSVMVRARDLANGGIVFVLALLSALSLPELPAEMAINFDAGGEPNNFAQAETFLAGSLLLGAGLAALFAVVPRIDPLGENISKFQTAYDAVAVATLLFHAYIHGMVLASNLGFEFDVIQATTPAVAGLYLFLAVLLWRVEQNWFVGIRTPWTLSDERVWNKTHRHTAPLFALAAVVSLGGLLFPEYGVFFLSVPVVLVAIGSAVYSFVLYERLNKT